MSPKKARTVESTLNETSYLNKNEDDDSDDTYKTEETMRDKQIEMIEEELK
jgi:hypothetical protein